MYTFEQLKEDVRKEAEALRVHATKEERERLSFDKLDPTDIHMCIYGLMTSSCHSPRAIGLIETCACRYVKDDSLTKISYEGFDRIQNNINGEKADHLLEGRTNFDFGAGHYSAIEAYILLPEAQNANLIAYLRGETDNLEL